MLDPAHFVDARAPGAGRTYYGKPYGCGLCTCTGTLGTYGMWRVHLDDYQSGIHVSTGEDEYALPWHTWAAEPELGARVLEVVSAADWADLILTYPRRLGDDLHPDWRAVADHHDAVHVTLRAILAAQGLYLQTSEGTTAPAFWDVETTFWLRWCFSEVRLVETRTQIAIWLEEVARMRSLGSPLEPVPFESVIADIDRFQTLPGAERVPAYFACLRVGAAAGYDRPADEVAHALEAYLVAQPDVIERARVVIAICGVRLEAALSGRCDP